MALSTSERNAISTALGHGGASAVQRRRYGVYQVVSASRPALAHTVTVDGEGRYACSCEAGAHGRPCWHAAAVYLAKVEAASGGRVTGPAPAAGGVRGQGATAATVAPALSRAA